MINTQSGSPSIVPEKGSTIVIEEHTPQILRVRTKMQGAWFSVLALAIIIPMAVAGIAEIVVCLVMGQWIGALGSLVGLVLGGSFLSLFLIGFTRDFLVVSPTEIKYAWYVGPFPLKRKRAAISEIKKLNCHDDEIYCLSIETSNWSARFGCEKTPDTINAIIKEIDRIKGKVE